MNCPKCGSEVEPGTPVCPDCSTILSANGGTACGCNVARIPIKRKKKSTTTEIFAVMLFFIGVGVLAFIHILIGVILIVAAFIISAVNKEEYTVMVCPNCGKEGITL